MPAFLLLSLLAGCLPEVPSLGSPALVGQDVHLTILHTTDLHSKVLPYDFDPSYTDQLLGLGENAGPYGGIARISYILQRERAKADRVIHVDSGDLFQGAIIFNEFAGEVEMRTATAAGLDVAVLGNHDFDKGSMNLAEKLGDYAGFYVLAANYDFEDADLPWASELEDIVLPSVLFDLDGLKVGFIGMANLSSMYSIWKESNSQKIWPEYAGYVIPRESRKLRALGADIVVVLSHLGLDDDQELAAAFPDDIDLILGGHHHVVTNPPLVYTDPDTGKRIPIVHSGAFAKFVGRLDLVIRDGEILSHDYQVFPVDVNTPQDPKIVEILEDYEDELYADYNLGQVIGYAEEPLKRYGSNGGDSMLGNLAADAIRFYPGVETEISLTNTLGIRSDIPAGDITLDQIYAAMPFDNTITTMYLTGREVKEMLDYVAYRSSERGCNSQAQVSGIRFVMNCTEGVAEDIVINGAPLDLEASYQLATNNYIANGGSGFEVLERNTTQQDTGISIRDVVINAIRTYRTLPQPGVAQEEGRIIPKTD